MIATVAYAYDYAIEDDALQSVSSKSKVIEQSQTYDDGWILCNVRAIHV